LATGLSPGPYRGSLRRRTDSLARFKGAALAARDDGDKRGKRKENHPDYKIPDPPL